MQSLIFNPISLYFQLLSSEYPQIAEYVKFRVGQKFFYYITFECNTVYQDPSY